MTSMMDTTETNKTQIYFLYGMSQSHTYVEEIVRFLKKETILVYTLHSVSMMNC